MTVLPIFASLQEFRSRIGDIVVKLFCYVRPWRKSHAVERAAWSLLAINRSLFLYAVASFVSQRGFTPDQGDAHAQW